MAAKKSVLIVDNSQKQSGLIEHGLRLALPGSGFVVKSDGESALEHLALCGERYPMPDRIIMDRSMDGIGGLEAIRLIRLDPRLRAVPILMASGSDDPDHIAQARHVGASAYFPKPPEEDGYKLWAARLASWQLIESWRTAEEIEHGSSTALALLDSTPQAFALPSRAMHSAQLAAQPNAILQLLAQAAGYFQGGRLDQGALEGVFTDQDEMDITFAERHARVKRSQVLDLDRFNDQDMAKKRRRFFGVLFGRGWALPQISERFPLFGDDYLKRIRADVHKTSTDRALPS